MRTLLVAIIVALLGATWYTACVASRVKRDVVYLLNESERPPGMIYVRFIKGGSVTVYAIPDSGESVSDLAAALLAADSNQNKEERWMIASGAEIHLIVPPKHGEPPMGTAHCERFTTVLNALQSTPGLEPAE